MRLHFSGRIPFLVTFVVVCSIILLAVNVYELQWMQQEHLKYHHDSDSNDKTENIVRTEMGKHLTFLAYGRDVDSGYLKHVFAVFKEYGYVRDLHNTSSNWDVLWAHDYPFRKLYRMLKTLKPQQKVNHFPGTGYITNKMDLATSNIPHIPRAFKIPHQKKELLKYAEENPGKVFVQKSNDHRGIKILTIDKIDMSSSDSFVQEYIDKPFLVDGYKFDIGVYTIITSFDPLRVYMYNGDILFRYCTEKYHPFDPKKVDKYVIGDDYLPTWEVPSMKKYYNTLGFSMRDSFNAYVRNKGKDPTKMWNQIEEAIRAVCLAKEPLILKLMTAFPSKRNFFEMVRFDFVVDEDLNVYIMEANMSPNLSSAHFPPNRLLYEQVLFNVFHLVGLAHRMSIEHIFVDTQFAHLITTIKQYGLLGRNRHVDSTSSEEMEVSRKNVLVYPEICSSEQCSSCMAPQCQLCLPCLTNETLNTLKEAYKEHANKHDCKRVFPPSMTQEIAKSVDVSDSLNPENQLMLRWFQGKCLQDSSWC